MMTFEEMIETGTELYPDDVNDAFKSVVFDWFRFREVCDDVKFPVFFKRVISRDYPQYEQLLRIEPGISTYDWLVQTYQESQTFTEVEGGKTTTKSSTGSTGQSGTITDSGTSSKSTSKTTEHDESDTLTKTIEKSEETTKSSTLARDESNGETLQGTKSGSTSDDTMSQLSGIDSKSKSLTHGYNETRARSSTTILDSDTTSSNSTSSDVKELGRATPMSSSYAGGGFPSGMDWTNPSSQAETVGSETVTGSGTRDDTTTLSGQDVHTGQNTDTGAESVTYGKRDSVDRDIVVSETTSSSKGITKDIDETSDISENTDSEVSESGTTTKDIDISEVGTETGTKGNTRTLGTTESRSGSESGSEVESTDRLVQHIHTGRNVDISTLLENAESFIKSSSAWAWMEKRLEVCFIGVY